MLQKQIEKKHVAKNHQCYTVVMILVPESSPLHLREPATVSGHRYIPTPYETFVARNPNAMFLHVLCFFSKLHYDGIIKEGKCLKRQYSGTIMTMKHSGEQVAKGNRREGQIFEKQVVVQAWPSKVLEGYGSREEIWRKKVVRRLFYLKYCMIMTINFYWLRATEGNCWKMTSCGTIIAQYHIAEARPAQSVCASSALGQF